MGKGMENERRKVQMFTAEQVEGLRSYLAQKGTEPPPQPEAYMNRTSFIPATKKIAGKWLFAEGARASV